QLDHMRGCNPRALMQIVDVLRHYAGRLAGAIEAGQRQMAATRERRGKMLLHGEAAPPGLVARLLAREEFVERDRPVLGPDPARRAEVRNAAFGRNAGAGE